MILRFFYSTWPRHRSHSWSTDRYLSSNGEGKFPAHLSWSWSAAWGVSTLRMDHIR